jgi:hypothetical protein
MNLVMKQREQFPLQSLGRFAEPILRRVAEVYKAQPQSDPEVIKAFTALITQATSDVTTTGAVH